MVEYHCIERLAWKALVLEGTGSDIETSGPSEFNGASAGLYSDRVPA